MAKTKLDENLLTIWVAAGCLIEKEGKFLLVQEATPDIYGLWNLPAGKVEKGQTIAEAAVREAKEETGYDVELIREIGIYHKEAERSLKHVFEARIIGGELSLPEDEIMDAKWLTLAEILSLEKSGQVRSEWIVTAIKDYLRNQNRQDTES